QEVPGFELWLDASNFTCLDTVAPVDDLVLIAASGTTKHDWIMLPVLRNVGRKRGQLILGHQAIGFSGGMNSEWLVMHIHHAPACAAASPPLALATAAAPSGVLAN